MDNRLEAAAAGNTKYNGSPCKTCSNTSRWVMNASCVPCSNKAAAERNRARRTLLKNALQAAREKKL